MGIIHKMADGPVTLTVMAATPATGNFGPQYCLAGEEGVDVYLSEQSTVQQLARLSLTPETVIGRTIRIEQVKKDGKTFTNIAVVGSGGSTHAAAAHAPSAAPAPRPPVDLPALIALYAECVNGAMMTLGLKCEEAGVPYDAAALQSAAATLFIKATR